MIADLLRKAGHLLDRAGLEPPACAPSSAKASARPTPESAARPSPRHALHDPTVMETGKPAPEVAKDQGINETTLASWVSRAKRAEKTTPEDKDALIARLTAEKAALKKWNKELGMERDDVLKRCMVLWVK